MSENRFFQPKLQYNHSIPTIYYTEAKALVSESIPDAPTAQSQLQRHGLVPHMPFLVDEHGSLMERANLWLRALPTNGSKSKHTWIAYARSFIDWYDFLKLRDKTPFEANKNDLSAYYAARRMREDGASWSPSTWNRNVSALDSFYQYAYEQGYIDKIPFTYRQAKFVSADGRPQTSTRNMAKEQIGKAHASIKWLSEEQRERFLSSGMNGLLPDGSESSRFVGLQAARNHAFARLLVGSGLRAEEATHLLIYELPELPKTPQKYVRMEIPAPVCKGKKKRWVLVPSEALRELHGYVAREHLTARQRKAWNPSNGLHITDPTPTGGKVNGKQIKWSSLSIEERRLLLDPEGGSPLLFVRRDGGPVGDWDSVFREASKRCQNHWKDFPAVSPHMLRHTFAVHMLQWLIEQIAQAISNRSNDQNFPVLAGYWRVHDPLLTLRDLLGHSSVATTQIYLQAIDATRLYANLLEDEEDDNAE